MCSGIDGGVIVDPHRSKDPARDKEGDHYKALQTMIRTFGHYIPKYDGKFHWTYALQLGIDDTERSGTPIPLMDAVVKTQQVKEIRVKCLPKELEALNPEYLAEGQDSFTACEIKISQDASGFYAIYSAEARVNFWVNDTKDDLCVLRSGRALYWTQCEPGYKPGGSGGRVDQMDRFGFYYNRGQAENGMPDTPDSDLNGIITDVVKYARGKTGDKAHGFWIGPGSGEIDASQVPTIPGFKSNKRFRDIDVDKRVMGVMFKKKGQNHRTINNSYLSLDIPNKGDVWVLDFKIIGVVPNNFKIICDYDRIIAMRTARHLIAVDNR